MPIPTLATYGGITLAPSYPGQVAETGPYKIESGVNESATPLDFGVAVCRGVAVAVGVIENVKPQGADGDVIIGISTRGGAGQIVASTDGLNTINYPRYAAVPFMKMGKVAVTAFENVVAGDGVIAVTAQGGKLSGTTAGAAGAGRIAVPGAVWQDTAAAGTVGWINILTA